MFANVAAVTVHVKSGRLRALAVASSAPTSLAPGLPTLSAAGLPGYESSSTYGIFGPARMPRPLVEQLNREMVNVLTRADTTERLLRAGMEAVASTPEQLAAAMQSDMAKMGKVIKDAGIRVEF